MEFSKISAKKFLQQYVREQFNISTLVIGKNHHIGQEKADCKKIQQIATSIDIIVKVIEDQKEN